MKIDRPIKTLIRAIPVYFMTVGVAYSHHEMEIRESWRDTLFSFLGRHSLCLLVAAFFLLLFLSGKNIYKRPRIVRCPVVSQVFLKWH